MFEQKHPVAIRFKPKKEGQGMLVLPRKVGESLDLAIPDGDGNIQHVSIYIVAIGDFYSNKQTILSFDAPRSVIIRRRELLKN